METERFEFDVIATCFTGDLGGTVEITVLGKRVYASKTLCYGEAVRLARFIVRGLLKTARDWKEYCADRVDKAKGEFADALPDSYRKYELKQELERWSKRLEAWKVIEKQLEAAYQALDAVYKKVEEVK